MTAVERWVRANPGSPIRISDAAAAIGLSERTLQPITAAAAGMTPVEFVDEVRLDQASFLSRSSILSAEAPPRTDAAAEPRPVHLRAD